MVEGASLGHSQFSVTMNRILTYIIFLCLMTAISVNVSGQETIRDTIKASIKIDTRKSRVFERIVPVKELYKGVTATGEPDYMKVIKRLPGVTCGAEGSSAIYVRGGNMGNNITTLDGAPIYGASHLLGMLSVISNDAIQDMRFKLGGFSADEANVTSSRMILSTKEGDMVSHHAGISISNFMIDAHTDGSIAKNKLSYFVSARWSPLQYEFKAIEPMINVISDLKTSVYDVFGKLTFKVSDGNTLSAYLLNTSDNYSFTYKTATDELEWSNLIGNLSWKWIINPNLTSKTLFYVNRYSTRQSQIIPMGLFHNSFGLISETGEISISENLCWKPSEPVSISVDLRGNISGFVPGSSYSHGGSVYHEDKTQALFKSGLFSSIIAGSLQLDYAKGPISGHLTTRLNYYQIQRNSKKTGSYIKPDFNVRLEYSVSPWLGIESTFDSMSQYYHTLEGLPIGWSMDLLVPSTESIEPERARQEYIGLHVSKNDHFFSFGGYMKNMYQLVYFPKAQDLFKASLSQWENNVITGCGISFGLETQYKYSSDIININVSYTLSKTNRCFEGLNEGLPFPAKFDRRNVLNGSLDVPLFTNARRQCGVEAFFTYQSGNWETVAEGHYEFPLISGGSVTSDYFGKENNYRMPAYSRWDIGIYLRTKGKKINQDVNFGLFNLLNRHNPFLILYNSDEQEWKQLSLLPIMPSIWYSLYF